MNDIGAVEIRGSKDQLLCVNVCGPDELNRYFLRRSCCATTS